MPRRAFRASVSGVARPPALGLLGRPKSSCPSLPLGDGMCFESHALSVRQLAVDVRGHPDARPPMVAPVAHPAHAVLAASRRSRARVNPAAATPSSITLISCELLRPTTAASGLSDRGGEHQ